MTDKLPDDPAHDEPVHERSNENGGEPIDELVAGYIDRFLDGEELDPDDLVAQHGPLGVEVLRRLELYRQLRPDYVPEAARTLGDFTLGQRIGRGGMGVVYEAWQQSLDRTVAVKVLPPGVAVDPRTCGRFVREAQIAAKLSHPNVVSVYGFGVEESTPYYAMELVEGETLAKVLARLNEDVRPIATPPVAIPPVAIPPVATPPSETPLGRRQDRRFSTEAAAAFAEVAEGLQAAHRNGVVHRDIKPSNLIFSHEDQGEEMMRKGRLRILDFGLAFIDDQEALTLSGEILGTPTYMSPEQAARKAVVVDHRTDIYSLGATLYETLTGEPPIRGRDPGETLTLIPTQEPRALTRLNPLVPDDLETIVLKCLAKDPTERYGTAEALAQDLRRFVRGDPIEARPLSDWKKLWRRARRHRTRLVVTAVVALLLISLGALAFRLTVERRKADVARYHDTVKESAMRLLQAELTLERGFTRELAFVGWAGPQETPIRKLVNREVEASVEGVLEALDEVARLVPRRAEAHVYRARGLYLLGRSAEALAALDEALRRDPGSVSARVLKSELRRKEPHARAPEATEAAEDDVLTAWLRARRAATSIQARRGETGELREAVAAYSELIESGLADSFSPTEQLGLRLERGLVALRAGDYEFAKGDFWTAYAFSAPHVEPLLLLGETFLRERKLVEASRVFEIVGRQTGNSVAPLVALAYQKIKDFDRALEWAQRVEDDFTRERLLSRIFLREGRRGEAIAAGREAIGRDPDDLAAHLELAWMLLEGEEPMVLEAEEVAQAALGLDPANRRARHLLWYVLFSKGDQTRARELESSFPEPGGGSSDPVGYLGGAFAGVRTVTAQEVLWPAAGRMGGGPREPSISHDGLKLFFSAPGGKGRGLDIWMATRSSGEEPFSSFRNLEINTPWYDSNASLSMDERRLYFSSTGYTIEGESALLRPSRESSSGEGASHKLDIFVATRSADGTFGAVRPVGAVNTTGEEASVCISADDLELYYGTDSRELWVATRATPDAPFRQARPLEELNGSVAGRLVQPSVSADGLVLFFDVHAPGEQSTSLWCASRPSKDEPYGQPVKLGPPVNSSVSDVRPSISGDWPREGSTIYFNRCWSTGYRLRCEIYQATWVPAGGGG